MKLKIEVKKVEVTNYVTSDKKYFDSYYEAEYHEKYNIYKKYEKEFDEIKMDILRGTLIKIKSSEKLELVRFYYNDVQSYVWNEQFDWQKLEFPCYILYSDYGNVYFINNKLGEELHSWKSNFDSTEKIKDEEVKN